MNYEKDLVASWDEYAIKKHSMSKEWKKEWKKYAKKERKEYVLSLVQYRIAADAGAYTEWPGKF